MKKPHPLPLIPSRGPEFPSPYQGEGCPIGRGEITFKSEARRTDKVFLNLNKKYFIFLYKINP
jgi:hypothetical protein